MVRTVRHAQNATQKQSCYARVGIDAVLEPVSTGIGGDCFALYYNARTKTVEGLNGSGRSPQSLTLEKARKDCLGLSTPSTSSNDPSLEGNGEEMDPHHIHSVTVPGAAAGWVDTIDKWGSLSLAEVLQPAIDLAREGFPVSPITAHSWKHQVGLLKKGPYPEALLIKDSHTGELRAPKTGELMINKDLARTFEALAKYGKDGFYKGEVAERIVELVRGEGGCLDFADLEAHDSESVDPISVDYKGLTVWEIPPNGQGLTALLALKILDSGQCPIRLASEPLGDFPSADDFHAMIESIRLAFSDTRYYCTDQEKVSVPVQELLSDEYAAQRARHIDRFQAKHPNKGYPANSCDTVSFQVVDKDGNAMSFINSNYMGFGSGLIPRGCGFTLQNRGHNFSLSPGHPNQLQPRKRPYHTIIPGMLTEKDSKNGQHQLFATFSNMGGFMQPQGHVQLVHGLRNMLYEPQTALDAPRFCIPDGTPDGSVCLERGTPQSVVDELRRRGHDVVVVDGWDRQVFGRGQIIMRNKNGVLWAGSDGRGDGCSIAY
eukprot:gb/GECG01006942.1/.p1 GENE.gb/GECG01006942.1/~~gb/GECG01006942.1/.p1  ORF type:complete len:545 (+),score=47.02 gb/GECG01006942.1/:1-1635(+)